MIDNNIIQSIGAGSGIDTSNLTKQLTEIERAAPQNRIDTKRDKAETQISDYGLMSNAMATLQDAANVLSEPEGLFSKSASFTQSNALVPVELDTEVQPGTYTFTVEAIASSQSLTSASFAAPTDAVGEGVLTFRFGNATVDGAGAMLALDGFSQDLEADEVDITIDSNNNSLEGLRDTINEADFGVQASIVNDGLNGYVLQITAESGANNEIEISVAEAGGSPTDNDNTGLSRFTFNETASQLIQKQGGQDAELSINGLTVYRESNTIDDIVEGLKLDILEPDPGTPITITITDDKAFAEQNIRDFVEAYNLFLEAIEPAIGTKEQENEDGDNERVIGSLANDALAKSMLSQIRSVIGSATPGLADSRYTSLGAIGIRTELDGTMSIDDKSLSEAFEKDFEAVQKLFAPNVTTSDNDIYINSYNDYTSAGEYDIEVTTAPSKGNYEGGTLGGITAFPDFDTSGQVYEFSIAVNGTASGIITIAEASYADQDALAAAIQAGINNDSNISDDGASVSVSYNSDNNRFDIVSNKYGSSSQVTVLTAHTDIETDLGLAVAAGTAGTTVAGTVNGTAGFGSSNVLLPAIGQPGEGLALIVGESATSATVNFSRGFAGELDALLEEFLGGNGLIATRETSLEDSLDKLDDDQKKLDRRMSSYEERLINQFIAMERILASLNTSGSFLENLIDTLPFTASRD
ncbi:flagellar hook-associated protein 2 [Alteromonadaceae bacterium Bs31]|nr:flagellar hook-associated protein 2 [Alteromonadaceae bacterium Bs31]